MEEVQYLADRSSRLYRLLKASTDEEGKPIPALLEVYREGAEAPEVFPIKNREALPKRIRRIERTPGPRIEGCVFNVELYASLDPSVPLTLGDPRTLDGLLTVAMTRDGAVGLRAFITSRLDDGGISFESANVTKEKLGTVLYELSGLWSKERKG